MIRGAFIGFGVSILCLMIPIVHFVSGPVGPFIGGMIGSSAVRAGPVKAVGVGLLMGVFMGGPALGLIISSQMLTGWATHLLIFIAIGLVLWWTILGILGALLAAAGRGKMVVGRFGQ